MSVSARLLSRRTSFSERLLWVLAAFFFFVVFEPLFFDVPFLPVCFPDGCFPVLFFFPDVFSVLAGAAFFRFCCDTESNGSDNKREANSMVSNLCTGMIG